MTKPTIQELEAILNSAGPHNVIIAPDGSIHVGVNMGDLTGICLKAYGGKTEVQVEIGGEWITVIREHGDTISHIVEPAGVQTCLDRHRANPQPQ